MIRRIDRCLAIVTYAVIYVWYQPIEAARNLRHYLNTGKPRG